jgi:hypothetical protein
MVGSCLKWAGFAAGVAGVNRCYLLVLLIGLGACAGPKDMLVVKQFKVLDAEFSEAGDPMIRCEKQRRLHGAISLAEFKARFGNYYTCLWSDPGGVGKGEVELLFEYQQGTTASQIKHMSKRFNSNEVSAETTFAIIGDNYFKNGRILAWKITLSRGGRVLATRKSRLWQ